MRQILVFTKLILGWTAYALSFLFPRDPKSAVFIGWHKEKDREIFADNSKYTFLYVFNNLKAVKPCWLGKDEKITALLKKNGLPAAKVNSLKGIFRSLRAGFTFVDGYMYPKNWILSGGSKIIQLWHGKGMKKTGYDTPYSLQRYKPWRHPYLYAPIFRTIATSKETAQMMASAFRLPPEKVLVTGLPRNDALFSKIAGSEIDTNCDLMVKIEELKKNAAKLILYAPTFRPDGTNPLPQIDLNRLNGLLEQKNYRLLISLHPKFAAKEILSQNLSHIFFIGGHYGDLYPTLKRFDALITDYSSLYVDFLLLDRPIIFFTYDIEKYRQDMGLYEAFERLTPGPHALTFDQLLDNIKNLESEAWNEKREIARQNLHAFADGNSSERVARFIFP